MKILYNVQGAVEQAVPLIIQKDTVYVHENIRQEEVEDMPEKRLVWIYDEIQYGKDEYLQKMADENKSMKDAIEVLITSGLEV